MRREDTAPTSRRGRLLPESGTAAAICRPGATFLQRNGATFLQRLVFLHANGFPAAVYGRFFAALAGSVEVIPIEILQTPLSTPPALRWPRMRAAVIERLRALGPVALCGHSMGGYLALLAASDRLPLRLPVVLIDAPLPAALPGAVLGLARRTGLIHRFGPAPIAARRRDRWRDRDEARRHFEAKPFVRRWAPGVLEDFLAHGLRVDAAGTRLRIPREEERDIYVHLPDRDARRAVKRLKSAGVPIGFVAGSESAEVRMAGATANRRWFGRRWVTVAGSHLIPLEAPEACARAVLDLLAEMPPEPPDAGSKRAACRPPGRVESTRG